MTAPNKVAIDGDTFHVPDSPLLIEIFDECVAEGIPIKWATGRRGYTRPDDTVDDRLAG